MNSKPWSIQKSSIQAATAPYKAQINANPYILVYIDYRYWWNAASCCIKCNEKSQNHLFAPFAYDCKRFWSCLFVITHKNTPTHDNKRAHHRSSDVKMLSLIFMLTHISRLLLISLLAQKCVYDCYVNMFYYYSLFHFSFSANAHASNGHNICAWWLW